MDAPTTFYIVPSSSPVGLALGGQVAVLAEERGARARLGAYVSPPLPPVPIAARLASADGAGGPRAASVAAYRATPP